MTNHAHECREVNEERCTDRGYCLCACGVQSVDGEIAWRANTAIGEQDGRLSPHPEREMSDTQPLDIAGIRERLEEFIHDRSSGGCRVLSQAICTCPLCDVDALLSLVQSLQAENAAMRSRLEEWENREAAVCPEDAGFEEVIAALTERLREAEQDIKRMDWFEGNPEVNIHYFRRYFRASIDAAMSTSEGK